MTNKENDKIFIVMNFWTGIPTAIPLFVCSAESLAIEFVLYCVSTLKNISRFNENGGNISFPFGENFSIIECYKNQPIIIDKYVKHSDFRSIDKNKGIHIIRSEQ